MGEVTMATHQWDEVTRLLMADQVQFTVERYSLIKPKKYLLRKLNLGLKASLRRNGRF